MSKPVRMLSRTRKPLIVAGAALAVTAFSATSAQAAEVKHEGARAVVYPDRVEKICDTQRDGNGAFVTVKRADGLEMNYWDGTGRDNYCGGPFYPNSRIVQFKVCEHHKSCSDWVRL